MYAGGADVPSLGDHVVGQTRDVASPRAARRACVGRAGAVAESRNVDVTSPAGWAPTHAAGLASLRGRA
jgi:hypothetical protein